jgi:hypothetical protein
MKLTVLCDLQGQVRYLSNLVPAARSDKKRMEEQIPKLQQLLDKRDAIILDKGYQSIDGKLPDTVVFIKHKKPKKGLISEELKTENRKMEMIRRKIETVIGEPKRRFKILSKKFRGNRQFMEPICHFLFAICEEIRKYNIEGNNYNSKWIGPEIKLPYRHQKQTVQFRRL